MNKNIPKIKYIYIEYPERFNYQYFPIHQIQQMQYKGWPTNLNEYKKLRYRLLHGRHVGKKTCFVIYIQHVKCDTNPIDILKKCLPPPYIWNIDDETNYVVLYKNGNFKKINVCPLLYQ